MSNKTKLNNFIGNLTDFTYYLKRKYKAKIIKDDTIIDINFIIKKIDTIFYESYLILPNISDLFKKDGQKEDISNTINIESDYIPIVFQLKIYLNDYIINIPEVSFNGDIEIYSNQTKDNTNKFNFDVLNTKSSKIFNAEKINNKEE